MFRYMNMYICIWIYSHSTEVDTLGDADSFRGTWCQDVP